MLPNSFFFSKKKILPIKQSFCIIKQRCRLSVGEIHVGHQTFSSSLIKIAILKKPSEWLNKIQLLITILLSVVPFTWDPRIVLNWFSSNPATTSRLNVAWRTPTTMLLATGRRVNDLTLLNISKDSFFDNREKHLSDTSLWV